MTALRYRKIHTFTSDGSAGNPAGCLYLGPGQQLADREMMDIASQHRGFVSEVVFCTRDEEGIHLIYYSTEGELDFCGHGTVACLYGLLKEDPALMARAEFTVGSRKKGLLTVCNQMADRDAVFVAAPDPEFIGTGLAIPDIAKYLGAKESSISTAYPVDLIDAGLRTLIVPMDGLGALASCAPNQWALRWFCLEHTVDIVLVYSLQVKDKGHIAHTRVFCPKLGYLEDPATGTGNSALGHYMLKNGLWDGGDCAIGQGDSSLPNVVRLSRRQGKILFGGSSTVRIDGTYYY